MGHVQTLQSPARLGHRSAGRSAEFIPLHATDCPAPAVVWLRNSTWGVKRNKFRAPVLSSRCAHVYERIGQGDLNRKNSCPAPGLKVFVICRSPNASATLV